MLQIRLSKPASEGGGGAKSLLEDTVTVACPDHLVLADLPVAKSLGSASENALLKNVGRRSRRQLGDRVHFCVRCDFPIAIYGRLSPCDHAFCLDCARSDSICYLCDERVQKIQTIKMMEGIFVCAAPHCLKSFLSKTEFKSHIIENHADLLHTIREKEGNESEATSARKSSASDSTVQAPLRPIFPSGSSFQFHDRELQRPQSSDQPPPRPVMPMSPFPGQILNHPSELQPDNNQAQIFDRPGPQNQFPQQTFDSLGGLQPNPVPINPVLAPPQFGYPPYAPNGTQQFYGTPYDMPRPDSTPEVGSEQGSLLGFAPGPAGAMNFAENYPRPWNLGPATGHFEPPLVGQGDYGRSMGILPPNLPPSASKGMEHGQGGHFVDMRDGKLQRGRSYSGDASHDGSPGFGWQHEKRDSFGSGQD
ncbi:RING/U-box superfamily protein [Forsythia ovata]|uniref:RING-type E3 ubiquitin transferase n=1 Tax=Forsythia ovata TaxID=205694 RepID=A0ABD1TBG3_9LAMI